MKKKLISTYYIQVHIHLGTISLISKRIFKRKREKNESYLCVKHICLHLFVQSVTKMAFSSER